MLRSSGLFFVLAVGIVLVGVVCCTQWTLAVEQQRALAAAEASRAVADKAVVDKIHPPAANHEWQLPVESWKVAFKDNQPITFINRGQDAPAWDALKTFWNPVTEEAFDPKTGTKVQRRAVKIRVPLGLNANPPVPVENPMTVAKWKLGKQLYFDPILSSDGTVACATCHDPRKGFTDRSPVSTGIRGKKGGMSAPTVFNSAYNFLQFWDGRAASLEDQAQGPVQNDVEMFDGAGTAWEKAVQRMKAKAEYVKQFKLVFGTGPTRDGAAKAIATYERTVLSGNSIQDRAEWAMRKRVDAEETGKYEYKAADYESVLKAAFAAKDKEALTALKLDPVKDQARIPATAKALVNGRTLFFNKARCSSCHVGDNFTDNTFHNLGVGIKDSKVPLTALGRYGAAPTGHKNPEFTGAFKTSGLRHLLGTAPYMHDGSEKTLEEVVEFYEKGGNANEYLDVRMRNEEAERNWYRAQATGKPYKGPEVKVFDGKAIVPLKLNLTKEEKADLVLFLRALQGDPADPIVADPKKMSD
jgi:cytochrome c peroxidase